MRNQSEMRDDSSVRPRWSKPFITLGQPVAGLLDPVSDSVGWDGILATELVRRDVILQHLSHDHSLPSLGNVLVVDGVLSGTEKGQYQSCWGSRMAKLGLLVVT